MEAQGSSQVRRLHIVYFLSRKGKIEHPHLVRVHHLSKNGVRLRDVKRWVGELRGKDMPDSFSWSYKRRYKTGYVWQDLVDDDLINPISDNEYVLKGSEISSTTIKDYSYADDKATKQKDEFLQEDTTTTISKQSHNSSETSMYISTKSSSEIEEESPTVNSETSTLTDDSITADHPQTEKKKDENKPTTGDKKERASTFYSSLLSKKSKKRTDKVTLDDEKISASGEADADGSKISSSSEPQSSKSKSNSNGTSNILRNLITCGALDTNDSALLAVNKVNHNNNKAGLLNICSSDLSNVRKSTDICKRYHNRLGGSQRVFGTPSWTQQQYWSCGRKSFDGVKDSLKIKSDLRDQRATCIPYVPVNAPNCSQCRKPFKPEKLHGHMKTCKGINVISKAAAAISADLEKASKNGGSISCHLLASN